MHQGQDKAKVLAPIGTKVTQASEFKYTCSVQVLSKLAGHSRESAAGDLVPPRIVFRGRGKTANDSVYRTTHFSLKAMEGITMLLVCTDELYYKREADWVGHKIWSEINSYWT